MATSGSTDFDLTRNQIIEQAYRKVGGLPDGDILTTAQFDNASIMLNAMVKNWAAEDIYLWKSDYLSVSLTASSVVLGTDGKDYTCIRGHVATADTRPITGSNYLSYWKALTTTTGAAWVLSTSYTSQNEIVLPSNVISVDNVRVRNGQSVIMLNRTSEQNYLNLAYPVSSGKPNQFYYEKSRSAKIFLYPYPDVTTYLIDMMAYRYVEDFDNSLNNPDYLQEWLLPLIDGLAVLMAPAKGIFGQQLADLTRQASRSKTRAQGVNHETGDVYFTPRLNDIYNYGYY